MIDAGTIGPAPLLNNKSGRSRRRIWNISQRFTRNQASRSLCLMKIVRPANSRGGAIRSFRTKKCGSFSYLDVVSAIQDYPLTGIGYGAFAQAYPVYRSDDVLHVRFFAENTYLEMIFELGIPIALVWFATLGALARRCFTGALQRQRHKVFPMAAAAVSVLAAAHAMLDFSLQITAVALLFAAIIGTGVAQSWPTRSR